jgi:hypothetical protein
VTELARRVKDYAAVADFAKERGDVVTYLAGLIAGSVSRDAKSSERSG